MDYAFIIIPIIVVITSQALKLTTDNIRGNFDLKSLIISYGGMPSSHSAFASSITTIVGMYAGIDSPIFGVCLVFTVLVMRDAVGFRNILGRQAAAINRLKKLLPKAEQNLGLPLREQVGHSVLEVLVGALYGGLLSWLLMLLAYAPIL